VSRFILGMPTFRESCSPLHQSEEQPDSELLRAVPFILLLLYYYCGVMWRKKRIVGGGGRGSLITENGFPYFIYVVTIISI